MKKKVSKTVKKPVGIAARSDKKKATKPVSRPSVKAPISNSAKTKVKAVKKPEVPVKTTELADVKKKKGSMISIREVNEVELLISRMPDELKDDSHVSEYVNMFRRLQDTARALEDKCSKGDTRSVYAQMKVYDQMREVIADIRALRDNNASVDDCIDRVVNPLVEAALQGLVAFRQEVRHAATQHIKNSDTLTRFMAQIDDSARGAAATLKESADAASHNIMRIFK